MSDKTDPRSNYEVNLDGAPSAGSIVEFDGHPFEVIGIEPYVRRDGTSTSMIVWKSHCVDCGDAIVVKTAFRSKTISKRCIRHKRRGAPATRAAMERMLTGRSRHTDAAKG